MAEPLEKPADKAKRPKRPPPKFRLPHNTRLLATFDAQAEWTDKDGEKRTGMWTVTLADHARALAVQKRLRAEYPDEPHADCDLWAVWQMRAGPNMTGGPP
jgi:hypothetical protein